MNYQTYPSAYRQEFSFPRSHLPPQSVCDRPSRFLLVMIRTQWNTQGKGIDADKQFNKEANLLVTFEWVAIPMSLLL